MVMAASCSGDGRNRRTLSLLGSATRSVLESEWNFEQCSPSRAAIAATAPCAHRKSHRVHHQPCPSLHASHMRDSRLRLQVRLINRRRGEGKTSKLGGIIWHSSRKSHVRQPPPPSGETNQPLPGRREQRASLEGGGEGNLLVSCARGVRTRDQSGCEIKGGAPSMRAVGDQSRYPPEEKIRASLEGSL